MTLFCGVTHQKTQRHVPEGRNPQLHGCENLKLSAVVVVVMCVGYVAEKDIWACKT